MKLYEMIGLAVILGLTVFAGISCTKAQADTAQDLTGVTWVLQSYGDPQNLTQAVPDEETTLVFHGDTMTVSGSGGVNGYGGDYTVKGNELTVTSILHTMMAGSGPIMIQENAFFNNLGGAETFKISGQQLTITGAEGALVLTQK